MISRNPDREWEQFGRRDPYYGVVSLERFHKDRLDDATRREFFQSGEDHVRFVFATIRGHVDAQFRPGRALDFGCGVGRCVIPLASLCATAIGLDVSESMLGEARRNCEARGLENVELLKSDDTLSVLSGRYDLIHAFLVFQHIPPARGERLFARLVERLADRGVGVFQFVYRREVPAAVKLLGALRKRVPLLHNVLNVAAGKPFGEPLMEKNVYSLNRLMGILHAGGCGNVHLVFEGSGRIRSAILFFQKQPDQVPYQAFFKD
jgi:SAM-dependent methyltransferase